MRWAVARTYHRRMAMPILIVGYGRFGRALADLFLEAGHPVSAIDPAVEVPDELSAGVEQALAGPSAVLLCVPVQGIAGALEGLADRLGGGHLVIDVCSVRAPVEQILRERLGDRVPWVGSHPLFGPSSIAHGERPMRVVICPAPEHANAAAQAAAEMKLGLAPPNHIERGLQSLLNVRTIASSSTRWLICNLPKRGQLKL